MKTNEVKILSTTAYSMFKKLEGNRPLNKGLLRVIHESLENDGNYLQYNPIIVNEKMEVIDGQHRLKVAEETEKPIFYIIANNFTLKQAQVLNSRKRSWNSQNFLESYLIEGGHEYQELKEICDEYHFSISICVKFLMQSFSRTAMDKFREGDLLIKDRVWAENALGVLSTVREYSPDYCFAMSSCQRAVAKMMEVLPDPKVFEKKLARYQTRITRRESTKDYLKQFQLILDSGDNNTIKLI